MTLLHHEMLIAETALARYRTALAALDADPDDETLYARAYAEFAVLNDECVIWMRVRAEMPESLRAAYLKEIH